MKTQQRKSKRPAHLALCAGVLGLLCSAPARSAERFTVCSITINSDDEIRTFQKVLPASQFDFVELANVAEMTPVGGEPGWLAQACQRGVRCDVLVLSGHFANAYAGSFGTTFAGTSGASLPLDSLERRSCDQSCPGVLANPLETFLFGCRTLATSLDNLPLSPKDLALLSSQQVLPGVAERIIEDFRYGGENTSNRARMRFVFSDVPRVYGFSGAAPIGKDVASRLESYLKGEGDYAKHLHRLRAARGKKRVPPPNRALERSLQPSTFTESVGLEVAGLEHERQTHSCYLGSEQNTVLARLEDMEAFLDEPGFLRYLPAIDIFFRAHDPSSFEGDALASLARIRSHTHARDVLDALVHRLEHPILRLEILRVAHAIGWVTAEEELRLLREIVVRLLLPPIYGEGRDLICGMDPESVKQIGIRADDVPEKVYDNEFGIQSLGCLKPDDATIQERLARSLTDRREWIARLAATALKDIRPANIDVQVALAEQLKRPDGGPRRSAAEALRELKPSDPRVLEAIRQSDPSFRIDWLEVGSVAIP